MSLTTDKQEAAADARAAADAKAKPVATLPPEPEYPKLPHLPPPPVPESEKPPPVPVQYPDVSTPVLNYLARIRLNAQEGRPTSLVYLDYLYRLISGKDYPEQLASR